MTEIQFYELNGSPLERALPRLLEKAVAQGFKALVLVKSEAEADMLNTALWTYDQDSFLPHGSSKDEHAEEQPIYITHKEENPNNANLLVVTDGSELDLPGGVAKLLDMVDGAEPQMLTKAKARFSHYQSQGHATSYIRQTPTGWKKIETPGQ